MTIDQGNRPTGVVASADILPFLAGTFWRIRQIAAGRQAGTYGSVYPNVRNSPATMIVSAIATAAATTATCRMRKLRVVPSKSLRCPPIGGSERMEPLFDGLSVASRWRS